MRGAVNGCCLCLVAGGVVLWRDADLRVVRVEGEEAAGYPGFLRVIWNAHVREMSDLPPNARNALMNAVFQCEIALREHLNPRKINLASLGNQTPHLHWHVVPRFDDDRHFPRPIWAEALRAEPGGAPRRVADDALKHTLVSLLGEALQDQ